MHLVQAQNTGLHGVQHVVADVGCPHRASQVPELHAQRLGQHGARGDAEHAEERTTFHVAIRGVIGRRGKPKTGACGDNDGGDALDGLPTPGPGVPPLSMRLLPTRLPHCQQLAEQAQQLTTGSQLPLAEEDELLRRDLGTGFDLGEVRTVVADPGSKRLLREPSRESPTAQVSPEAPRALLHGTHVGRSGGHAATPTPPRGRMWVIYVGSRQPRTGRVVMKRL
jgi:hypothetical protein